MPYSEFDLPSVRRDFDLTVQEPLSLFEDIAEVLPSEFLQTTLKNNVPFAGGVNTEKAKSELIVNPILMEVCRVFNYELGFFSGAEFNVDSSLCLTGYCDFILSATPGIAEIRAPVVIVVEAKNDSIPSGLGQCAAEMIAAQLKNQRDDRPIKSILGAVTTGSVWKFLHLDGNTLLIDRRDYFLNEIGKILGILVDQVRYAKNA